MLGQIVYQRLLPYFRKAWTRDVEVRVKDLRQHLSAVQAELAELQRSHRKLVIGEWMARRALLLPTLDSRLNADAIRAHVTNVVRATPVTTEPTTYAVFDRVLPDDFYTLLAEAIPPAEMFPTRDPVKTDYEMDEMPSAPEVTRRVWQFFDNEVVAKMLAPAILERFHDAVVAHYAETGGTAFGERAAAIPHRTVAGRIQLRRPGYHLRPHLDPKRVAITGLMYFAQPGDPEAYGTQLFKVDRPFVASGMKTFFPEEEGLKVELAYTVPFRANTLLAFVNSRAAHGATLPADAPLHERFAFQFYIKPDDGELKKLLKDVPESARAAWSALA